MYTDLYVCVCVCVYIYNTNNTSEQSFTHLSHLQMEEYQYLWNLFALLSDYNFPTNITYFLDYFISHSTSLCIFTMRVCLPRAPRWLSGKESTC